MYHIAICALLHIVRIRFLRNYTHVYVCMGIYIIYIYKLKMNLHTHTVYVFYTIRLGIHDLGVESLFQQIVCICIFEASGLHFEGRTYKMVLA